jgi:hypothetical protein
VQADPEVSNPDRLDRVASSRPVVLQPDAVAALDRSTEGSPQQRALISGLAMFMARLESESRVTASHVEAAASVARGTDIGTRSSATVLVASGGRPPAMMRASGQPSPAPRRIRRTHWLAIGCIAAMGAMAPWSTTRSPIDFPAVHRSPRQEPERVAAPPSAVVPPPLASKLAPVDPQPTVPLHVQISYPQGNSAAAREGSMMARRLRDDGYAVDDPAPVGPDVLSHGTTFFLQRDTAAATVLAKRLQDSGLPVQLTPSLGTGPGNVRIVLFGAGVPVRVRHVHRHARRHRVR